MEALRDHVSVDRRARKTHLDQWIGFLCFVFDLNYRESIQIVKEQGYYRKPFERTDFKNPAARALVREALGTVDLYMETFGQTIPDALREFFQDHPKMALAFSGGTDSAYLLYAARACGCHVRAYYAASPFQPAFELEDAKKLAVSLKAEMTILPLNVLELSAVRENPSDRCYHCKNAIFSRILEAAEKDGFLEVMDGTNASDDAGDRPGMRALRELRVTFPPAGLRRHQKGPSGIFPERGTLYLEQAGLCLPCHQSPHWLLHRPGDPKKDRAGRDRPHQAWLF